MDEEITSSVGFRASIPLVDKRMIIKLALLVDGILIQKSNIDFSRFFPISKTYGYAYALKHDRMITYRKSSIVITCDPSRAYLFKREFMLLKEIWKKNMLGGRKAVLGRLFYHLVKPFKRKELWIISDRIMNADDNGEALFSYIMKHRPKGVKAVLFVTKQFVDEHPELVQQMIDEGHIIGNHTCAHPAEGMPSLGYEAEKEDITTLHQMVKDQFGYEMKLFRYPSGLSSEQSLALVQSLGYKSVFWSFAHHDWVLHEQPDEQETLQKCLTSIHPGAIYLLHAVSTTNTHILADFIDGAREKGFEFGVYPVN